MPKAEESAGQAVGSGFWGLGNTRQLGVAVAVMVLLPLAHPRQQGLLRLSRIKRCGKCRR